MREIAVVGGGPAGIWVSSLLLKLGHSVTLIESGYSDRESSSLSLKNYLFHTPSSMPKGAHTLGGGGNLWFGRIGEFLEDDFSINGSTRDISWPISKDKLKKHYKEAGLLLMGSESTDDDVASDLLNKLKLSPSAPFDIRIFRYAKLDTFEKLLADMLTKSNFTLSTGTYCREISLQDANNSNSKVALTLIVENECSVIKLFDQVIVSGGCLQSTALMLRSKSLHGFEGARLIGKGLMEHFDGYVGNLVVRRKRHSNFLPTILLNQDRRIAKMDADFGVGIRIDQETSATENLISMHLEVVPKRNGYYFDIKNRPPFPTAGFPQRRIGAIVNALFFLERGVRKIIHLVSSGFSKLIDQQEYSLWVKGEELLNENSKVSISESLTGDDVLEYEHRISNKSSVEMRRVLMFAKVEIERQGLGKVHFYRGIIQGTSPLYLNPNWHPMGTLRMGKDFRTSVCDKNLRFGGYKNIFMLNSGVFPTGSNSNPTYTVLALASYLVETFEKISD